MGSTMTKNIVRIQAYDSVMCGYLFVGFIDSMLKDKSLIDFNILFSPNDLKKMMIYFWTILEMVESNSSNIYSNLNNQQQFRLNKINELKDYFVAEIKEKELMG